MSLLGLKQENLNTTHYGKVGRQVNYSLPVCVINQKKSMIIQPNTATLLDWQAICLQYPAMWVLVGVPAEEVGKPKDIRKGFVLFAGADENEFNSFSAQHFATYFENDTYKKLFTKFTGIYEQTPIKRVGLFRKID